MSFLLLAALACFAIDDPPNDVVEFFRTVVEALDHAHSDDPSVPSDARPFLDQFDPSMPGYEKLRGEIEALIANEEYISSTVEFVSDQGDERKRSLELDWVLAIDANQPKRAILKCTIEKRGRKWKITRLDPVEFFQK